jgi:hypothetical protein
MAGAGLIEAPAASAQARAARRRGRGPLVVLAASSVAAREGLQVAGPSLVGPLGELVADVVAFERLGGSALRKRLGLPGPAL